MDYMKLKLAIYESYCNGELTSEACSHLIDHLDEKYGESIAEEAASAENEFINTALNVFTESAGEEALTEAAKNFGAKVKDAWEKFKTWIKNIIAKILSLGKKPEQQKAKIQVPKALDKALSDAKKWIAKLGGAKTAGAMAAAIAGIVSSTALIVKNHKLKETIGAKVYEYEKFKKEQADLVKQMQDAALKAQEEINNWKNNSNEVSSKLYDAENKIEELNTELDKTKRELSAAENTNKTIQATNNIKQGRINELRKKINEFEQKLNAAKKASAAPAKTNGDSNVSDSKILSASTGFVNAVTSVVTYLLPQFSSNSADELNGKIQAHPGSFGSFAKKLFIEPPRDLELLKETSYHNEWNYIDKWIKKSISSISDKDEREKYKDEFSKVDRAIFDRKNSFSDEFITKLNGAYDLSTSEGIERFANDYSLNKGFINLAINNAINLQKTQIDSILRKYDRIAPVPFEQKKFSDAVSDYEKLYDAYNVVDITYREIRNFAIEARKKINPADKREII